MNIESVKIKNNGYLLNSIYFVPNDPENTYFKEIQKWITNGNTPEAEFTTSECKENLRQKLIAVRKKYLQDTDFRVLRFIDENTPYPNEVKEKRILARSEINEIELCTTLSQLDEFSEAFE